MATNQEEEPSRELTKAEILRLCRHNRILVSAAQQKKLQADLSGATLTAAEKTRQNHIDFVSDLTGSGVAVEVLTESTRVWTARVGLEKLWVFMDVTYSILAWRPATWLWGAPPARPLENDFEHDPRHMHLTRVITLLPKTLPSGNGEASPCLLLEDDEHVKLTFVCTSKEEQARMLASLMKLVQHAKNRAENNNIESDDGGHNTEDNKHKRE
ncbi:hypothetical protein SPRG_01863 [Saprolegnia parasitica CBS 223.65]|uniref:PH domain-containing protein n=1 Tax=Saprolegnia parasitica (strain CBS 223.65) TaxID=695850 RepID=A0A067CRA3_SAPPC|nr:hypothetical protein SPRG_01863 [Saprolegnia parasitica CBS 223.65]KDO33048.1 hypothetical protein SPRG_01863 [Saprolegnia parasitica CBS 223.65]|eukprot:XP_012195819.1 hypothetical protein SPRG_01863 [Saprolegnia parasitica CBS 223.65]